MSDSDPAFANLNEGFAVAINIVAKDGKSDAVADILQGLIAPTMAEKGCEILRTVPFHDRPFVILCL